MKNEELRKIRGINAMDYLERFEPGTMVQDSENEWRHKDHDSLKFSGGMFHWFSRGIGGRSALDYLIKVEEMDFKDAVNRLCECYPELGVSRIEKVPERPNLMLPRANENNDTVIAYLEGRGISRTVLDEVIRRKMLYENSKYHSAVFVGYDENRIPKYAMYRSTNDMDRKVGEFRGSDKRYSFRITNSPMQEVHLFESAIDLLSYATLLEIDGENWQEYNLISTGGVTLRRATEDAVVDTYNKACESMPLALQDILNKEKDLKRIYCHFDSDIAGRACSEAIYEELANRYEVYDDAAPIGKDFNEYLMICKNAA